MMDYPRTLGLHPRALCQETHSHQASAEVGALGLYPQPHPLLLKGSTGANILNHGVLLKIRCFCQRATFHFLQTLIPMQPTEEKTHLQ